MSNQEWEARQKDRERKQKEWEERQRERERKHIAWENKVNSSKSHLDTILSMARDAQPYSEASSAFADTIIAIATGGVSSMLQSLLGERNALNERSSYLSSCSNKLKQARDYFSRHKFEMIGEDTAQAFAAMSSIQEKLNAAWGELKDKRQKVNESLQRAREEKEKERAAKQAAWEERQRIRAEKQRIWEEKQKAFEERQKIKAEKQKEWEARQKERAQKQKEWEARQRERESKQREWEERQRERERRQSEWQERQRSRERRSSGGGGGSRSGRKKKDCYLSTACVEHNRMPDDCYELRCLRSFRDNYLLQFQIGKDAVEEYYRIAPAIVTNINKRKSANTIWQSVYQDVVIAVKLIEAGDYEAAFNHYKHMTYKLLDI